MQKEIRVLKDIMSYIIILDGQLQNKRMEGQRVDENSESLPANQRCIS